MDESNRADHSELFIRQAVAARVLLTGCSWFRWKMPSASMERFVGRTGVGYIDDALRGPMESMWGTIRFWRGIPNSLKFCNVSDSVHPTAFCILRHRMNRKAPIRVPLGSKKCWTPSIKARGLRPAYSADKQTVVGQARQQPSGPQSVDYVQRSKHCGRSCPGPASAKRSLLRCLSNCYELTLSNTTYWSGKSGPDDFAWEHTLQISGFHHSHYAISLVSLSLGRPFYMARKSNPQYKHTHLSEWLCRATRSARRCGSNVARL
jgi:hypothetical protein